MACLRLISLLNALLVCLSVYLGTCEADSTYYIGTGRFDVTGPAVETEMVSTASAMSVTYTVLCLRRTNLRYSGSS